MSVAREVRDAVTRSAARAAARSLWVLSAITGSGVTFTRLDRDVLWETVYAISLRTPPDARALLESVLTAGTDLFLDFELDERPLVSGLRQIAEVLAGMEAQLAADYKVALLRIGAGVAKARSRTAGR